jgi:tetrapyrrole methylase family protein/MazG family protein
VSNASAGGIVVVGLGPGDASLLTVEARDVLAGAPEVWLRTRRHPTVHALPAGPRYESFDSLYDSLDSFEAVYEAIVARVVELGRRDAGVVYAVPGHPLFGEATVRDLIPRARGSIGVRVVSAVSFVDVVAEALGFDPLDEGMLVLDALELGAGRRMAAPERPTLVAQVYDRRIAAQCKVALLEAYPPEHAVKIVRAAGTPDAAVAETALAELDRADRFDHLATLYLPPVAMTENVRSFEGVRAIVARLRAPDGGCPWDLEQTHETLKRFLIEEAYEALDAVESGTSARIAEELGDLLMQVLLHAQIGEDEGTFTVEDVFAAIGSKLVRRHPHVFGDTVVSSAGEVAQNWEELKKVERGGEALLDAVPRSLPALMQAQTVQSRAEKAGIVIDLAAHDAAAAVTGSGTLAAERLGDLLFAIVQEARAQGIDAEDALRASVRRFREHVTHAESGRT